MFPAIHAPAISLPYSTTQCVEKKYFLKEGDVLNIEELIKKHTKSFITFDNQTQYSPFSDRLKGIRELENNWDNYGAYAPNPNIIRKVEGFLEVLPKKYSNLLEEDNIFPNPHGTISIEWRTAHHVISIEFGLTNSNYYSIINNIKDFDENVESILSSKKLINAFNKITA